MKNKLPKEKRERLMLTMVFTGFIASALYVFLITPQQENIREHEDKLLRTRSALEQANRWRRMGLLVQSNVTTRTKTLQALETGMAPLDKFKWFYNTLENFRSRYDVLLVDIDREPQIGDVNVLPKFPYQAATFGVKLSATFHDFGKFLADFENQFPYMRVQDVQLDLDPTRRFADTNSLAAANVSDQDRERLAISMKVVTLVKPATAL